VELGEPLREQVLVQEVELGLAQVGQAHRVTVQVAAGQEVDEGLVEVRGNGDLNAGWAHVGVIIFGGGIGKGGVGGDELAEVGEVLGEVGLGAESREVDVDLEGCLRGRDAVLFVVEDGRLGRELGGAVQRWNHHLRQKRSVF